MGSAAASFAAIFAELAAIKSAHTTPWASLFVAATAMRRVTLFHGIVAFVFNTAVLALSINVGASLLS